MKVVNRTGGPLYVGGVLLPGEQTEVEETKYAGVLLRAGSLVEVEEPKPSPKAKAKSTENEEEDAA